ncbi:MAG: acylphosphatase [Acidobacteria bacterium]|nr:acylphosphatase [Acidobacteriota bacterium]
MRATRYLITGIVQGVGFRFFTERAARSLGLRGYVRNRRDGRVEAVAAGSVENLEAFMGQLRVGPAGAKVDGIMTDETELNQTIEGFDIQA